MPVPLLQQRKFKPIHPYYLGGYYLIKERPMNFGSFKSETVCTCSNCINDSLIENWSYSWTTDNNSQIENIKQEYQISDEVVASIRQWVDQAFQNKRIGWINLFLDLETANEYKNKFFSHLPNIKIIAIYFTDPEIEALLSEFHPQHENLGSIGLIDNLSKKILEKESSTEIFIGFDVIGIEPDGSFHTFYCHDISNDLIKRFGLTINKYVLFEDIKNRQPVLDFMNDEQNGFEPVPWFICKAKLVTEVL